MLRGWGPLGGPGSDHLHTTLPVALQTVLWGQFVFLTEKVRGVNTIIQGALQREVALAAPLAGGSLVNLLKVKDAGIFVKKKQQKCSTVDCSLAH